MDSFASKNVENSPHCNPQANLPKRLSELKKNESQISF